MAVRNYVALQVQARDAVKGPAPLEAGVELAHAMVALPLADVRLVADELRLGTGPASPPRPTLPPAARPKGSAKTGSGSSAEREAP